jgi:hypothetical protein
MEQSKVAAMEPGERSNYLEKKRSDAAVHLYGPVNTAMVCPHCQTKGSVRTKQVTQKKGVSGGKATAAPLGRIDSIMVYAAERCFSIPLGDRGGLARV